MTRFRAFPGFSAIVLVIAAASAAQGEQAPASQGQGPVPAPRERLERWFAAVERHEPGTLDAVARDIASWPDEHLIRVVADVVDLTRFLVRAHIRFLRTGELSGLTTFGGRTLSLTDVQRLFALSDEEAAAGDVGRLAARAALLHTDITVELGNHDPLVRSRVMDVSRSALLVSDGRQQGMADRGPHWELARRLLDLLPPDPPYVTQKRQWYVATAAFLHSRGHLADLGPHLSTAGRLFPSDAEILFYTGSMHETFASPSIQQAVREITASAGARVGVRDARTHSEEARRFFRRALEAEPAHVEARVRLGHVLGGLGRHDEALVELQQAQAAPMSPRLEYFAALFLGGAQERLGHADAAGHSFERAAALFPRAQSPRLALSSLARARGDRSAAMQTLKALPATREDDSLDPWWTYFAAPVDRADQLLLEWRRSVTNRNDP